VAGVARGALRASAHPMQGDIACQKAFEQALIPIGCVDEGNAPVAGVARGALRASAHPMQGDIACQKAFEQALIPIGCVDEGNAPVAGVARGGLRASAHPMQGDIACQKAFEQALIPIGCVDEGNAPGRRILEVGAGSIIRASTGSSAQRAWRSLRAAAASVLCGRRAEWPALLHSRISTLGRQKCFVAVAFAAVSNTRFQAGYPVC